MPRFNDIIGSEKLYNLGIEGPLEPDLFQENDLLPKIHSALANWIGETYDFEYIPTVLSLASEMLDSPASIRLIHAILYGKRWHLTRDSQNGLTTKYELDGGILPGETVRIQCAKGLKEIEQEKWISLGIFTKDDTDLVARGKECFTWRDRGRVSSFDDDSLLHEKDGNPSTIWISHDLFNLMDYYRDNVLYPEDYIKYPASEDEEYTMHEKVASNRAKWALHRLQFYVATLICHEAIRAINFAISHDIAEPRFRNHPHDNLGYAWEKEVLGGTLHLSDPEVHLSTLCFTDEARSHHLARKKPLGISPNAAMEEVPTVRYTTTTYWLVPMEFVAAIARQDCWNQARSQWYNFEILHIPKMIGLRVSTKSADQKAQGSLSKSSEEGGKQNLGSGHTDKEAAMEVGSRRSREFSPPNHGNRPKPSLLRQEVRLNSPLNSTSNHPGTSENEDILQQQSESEEISVPRDDDDDEEDAEDDVLDLEGIDWGADGEEGEEEAEDDGGGGGDDNEEEEEEDEDDLPDVEPEDEEWISPQHMEWSDENEEEEEMEEMEELDPDPDQN